MHKKQIVESKLSFFFIIKISVSFFRRGPNGTFGFSAPEVALVSFNAHAHYTHKADIWSVGSILYWINYGDAPKYDRNNNCHQPPSGIPPSKDRNVIDILRHTLRMDPKRRPETNWLVKHPFIR